MASILNLEASRVMSRVCACTVLHSRNEPGLLCCSVHNNKRKRGMERERVCVCHNTTSVTILQVCVIILQVKGTAGYVLISHE